VSIIERCLTCGKFIPIGDKQEVRLNGKSLGYVHGHSRAEYGKPCRDSLINKYSGRRLTIGGLIPVLSRVAQASQLPSRQAVKIK